MRAWIGIGVLAALFAWPGGGAEAQDASGALAAGIMQRLAALPDRQAAFTDSKTLSSLAVPLRSSGRLVFRHPGHLEKLTLAPRAERLVIEGGTLTVSQAGGAARIVELEAHPALHALATIMTATLAGDLARLRQLFVVSAAGTQADWRIMLTPADPALRRFLASITIDGDGADLRSLRIVQANGDTETIQVQPGVQPGR